MCGIEELKYLLSHLLYMRASYDHGEIRFHAFSSLILNKLIGQLQATATLPTAKQHLMFSSSVAESLGSNGSQEILPYL
jgi:hypothetical protein